MKKCIIYIVSIIALLIIGSTTFVYATDMNELQQKRDELKIKIDAAGKDLENININITENLEAINRLDEDIYSYEQQIETISTNLEQIEIQIRNTEKYLETLEERYNNRKDLLQRRLVAWYEAGPTRYLDVLLNSKSIINFISNYYFIAEITQNDKDLLDTIQREKEQIEQIEQSLKNSKENLKVIKTEQKKVAIAIENSKTVKSSYINKLTNEELKTKEDLAIYQDELNLVELEILMTAMENGGSQYVGGTFAWPSPGYYTITSKYGMRFHPVIKTYCNHSGMDIGAPMGSYAVAANAGIVTKATYSNSYGNMVMIDHGGGVTTLYAHGSQILVNVGDVVERGTPIMKTGSTGWSTGPHLHFEIRINGKTIDPYPYVTTN